MFIAIEVSLLLGPFSREGYNVYLFNSWLNPTGSSVPNPKPQSSPFSATRVTQ